MSDLRQGVAVPLTPSSASSDPTQSAQGWRSEATQAPTLDGRHARSQRTHQAVLDGLQQCLEMGNLQPTAKHIATQAGVSLRGVFRHFEHLESLLLELDKREHDRIAQGLRPCDPAAPLAKRIDTFLAGCAKVYEGTAPVRRALQRYAASSEPLERYRDRQRVAGHKKILALFEQELTPLTAAERRERVQEISAMTSWTQWEELRHYEGLAPGRARKILAREMSSVLAPKVADAA